MNFIGIRTIIKKELVRTMRVPFQTIGQPVVSTLLYFVVFGAAIGSRIGMIEGLSYTEFIMPGLVMMNILVTTFFSTSSALLLAKMMNTFSDLLVAPLSYLDIVIGYVGSAVIRGIGVGVLIYATALFFVPVHVEHAVFLIIFAALVAAAFSLFGLIVGIGANNFEQVSILPTFIITPLVFLGGLFYSLEMLPPLARTLSHGNPFFYMIAGMRYGFYGVTDVSPVAALAVVLIFIAVLGVIGWAILRAGWRIKS